MLAVIVFLAFWIVIAVALFFVALRGGPRGARATLQSQSHRSRRGALVFFTLFYLGVGIAVPLLLIEGDRDEAGARVDGGTVHLTAQERHGQEIFGERCGSCHTLAAAHTFGKVGPNLDQLKPPTALVLSAVNQGRQRGNGTMPAQIVQGTDAAAVAAFVGAVAGK
jgi:mono/diheme cytochrome c family protein